MVKNSSIFRQQRILKVNYYHTCQVKLKCVMGSSIVQHGDYAEYICGFFVCDLVRVSPWSLLHSVFLSFSYRILGGIF